MSQTRGCAPDLGRGPVVGVVLAAGAGRRAGGPKVLRRDATGRFWARQAWTALLDGGCDQVVVVLGAAAEQARSVLGTRPPEVALVTATDWRLGISASLRQGLAAAAEHDPEVVLVHLVDLPEVPASVVRRLLHASGSGPDALARAVYRGRPGHPVLIGRYHLAGLADRLDGDSGGQSYLLSHPTVSVECGDLASGTDQDGPP